MTASRPSVTIRFFNRVMISWSMAAMIRQSATISTVVLAVKVAGDGALIIPDKTSTSDDGEPHREKSQFESAGEGITRGETEH